MQNEVLAMVVGGGPAPGINGVISAATIEAVNEGVDVLGIIGGFKTLFEGKEGNIKPLTIDDVSRLHAQGGSVLGTSRDFPDDVQEKFKVLMSTIRRLGIDYLVTIGGEGTLFMANWIYKEAQGAVKVVHVPKTIDNDIPLPGGLATFGYETARHLGVQIVNNLMEDARTTNRWYLVTTMGRYAGHLALGIGKAAGATVTLIPEEFGESVTAAQVADVLIGSVIKRLCMGKEHGVAVLAEGISEKIIVEGAGAIDVNGMEKDDMGRVRLSELPLGEMLKKICRGALDSLGLKVTIVDKNVGYELRAAAPIPFDVEYTRNLGYGAVRFLLGGGTGSTVVSDEHEIRAIPFSEFINESGKSRIRTVDIGSQIYQVARKYMIRLEPEDFKGKQLRRLAETIHMSPEKFEARFSAATGCAVSDVSIINNGPICPIPG